MQSAKVRVLEQSRNEGLRRRLHGFQGCAGESANNDTHFLTNARSPARAALDSVKRVDEKSLAELPVASYVWRSELLSHFAHKSVERLSRNEHVGAVLRETQKTAPINLSPKAPESSANNQLTRERVEGARRLCPFLTLYSRISLSAFTPGRVRGRCPIPGALRRDVAAARRSGAGEALDFSGLLGSDKSERKGADAAPRGAFPPRDGVFLRRAIATKKSTAFHIQKTTRTATRSQARGRAEEGAEAMRDTRRGRNPTRVHNPNP